jgi:hypothetical protein
VDIAMGHQVILMMTLLHLRLQYRYLIDTTCTTRITIIKTMLSLRQAGIGLFSFPTRNRNRNRNGNSGVTDIGIDIVRSLGLQRLIRGS